MGWCCRACELSIPGTVSSSMKLSCSWWSGRRRSLSCLSKVCSEGCAIPLLLSVVTLFSNCLASFPVVCWEQFLYKYISCGYFHHEIHGLINNSCSLLRIISEHTWENLKHFRAFVNSRHRILSQTVTKTQCNHRVDVFIGDFVGTPGVHEIYLFRRRNSRNCEIICLSTNLYAAAALEARVVTRSPLSPSTSSSEQTLTQMKLWNTSKQSYVQETYLRNLEPNFHWYLNWRQQLPSSVKFTDYRPLFRFVLCKWTCSQCKCWPNERIGKQQQMKCTFAKFIGWGIKSSALFNDSHSLQGLESSTNENTFGFLGQTVKTVVKNHTPQATSRSWSVHAYQTYQEVGGEVHPPVQKF